MRERVRESTESSRNQTMKHRIRKGERTDGQKNEAKNARKRLAWQKMGRGLVRIMARLGAGFEIQKTNLSPASSRKWQVHSIIAKYQKLQIEVSQWQVSTAFCSKNSSYVSFEEAC